MSKSIEELKAERREIDRRIKAQIRAEQRQRQEALLSARQDLGLWLTEAVGADTVEQVEQVREYLGSDNRLSAIRNTLATSARIEPAPDVAPVTDDPGAAAVADSPGSVLTDPAPIARDEVTGSPDRNAPHDPGPDGRLGGGFRPLA